ncbi:MAG TPA: hypothetical protein VFN92_08415, partial [Solirubrobacterales bacterium]|nr:hypothetical protein [Solirubrobacterales bacterium]
MELKPLLIAALVALSLGLVACGDSGSDSTSSGAETAPPASGETTEESEAGGETESTGSEPAPSGEAQKSEKVDIVEFTYQPDPVVVQVDGKVIWQ